MIVMSLVLLYMGSMLILKCCINLVVWWIVLVGVMYIMLCDMILLM